MKEIREDIELVAYCGLYCGACGSYLKEKCNGCNKNEKATWCKIRLCCKAKGIATCAECIEYANPKDCRKFNNIISKIFVLIFNSDRAACIAQIKKSGISEHVKIMTELKSQTIKKS